MIGWKHNIDPLPKTHYKLKIKKKEKKKIQDIRIMSNLRYGKSGLDLHTALNIVCKWEEKHQNVGQ